MIVEPVVNRIADEWQSGRVLRLNMGFLTIQEYSEKLDVERTPTFVLFDENGREMMRWIGEAPDWEELPGNS